MGRRTIHPATRRRAFLIALAATGNVTLSAQRAKLSHSAVYEWRRRLPKFAAAWAEAVEQGADMLEDAALERAIHGVAAPVLYQGAVVATTRKYSDRLLMFLLQAWRPEKYRDRGASARGEAKPVTPVITVSLYDPDDDPPDDSDDDPPG